jgi:protein TonB
VPPHPDERHAGPECVQKEKEMFETAILSNGPRTKRVWATIAGFTGQVIVIGFALIAPLLFPQVIPKVAYVMPIAPPAASLPPPAPGGNSAPRHPHVVPVNANALVFREPTRVPTTNPITINDVDDAPVISGGPVGVPNGAPNGVPWGIPTGTGDPTGRGFVVPKPPDPPKPVTAAAPNDPPSVPARRISVVKLATPIHRVDPIYPHIAKTAGISGTVELVGVLGADGRIRELRVLRGHPLLINAALDAVKQWVYAPTLLNGEPVEVQAPITVNFILNR